MRAPHPKIDLWGNLPARLGHARDEALGGQFAEGEPGDFKSANKGAAASGDLAAVHHPGGAGIAGELGQADVVLFRFQLSALSGIFLDRRALAFIAVNPGCLCHKERAM